MRELSGKPECQEMDSADVIKWTLAETCESMGTLTSLWAFQGLDYCHRWHLWKSMSDTEDCDYTISEMQESDAISLRDLHGPWESRTSPESKLQDLDQSDPVSRKLCEAWKTLKLDDGGGGYSLHEEQEREVAHEVEKERQVQRPLEADPHLHKLHPDLVDYVSRGIFPRSETSSPFQSALEGLRRTTASSFLSPNLLLPQLIATEDFIHTVISFCKDDSCDGFLKPVNWVLTSIHNETFVIISQYEANELLPLVKKSQNTALHVYSPKVTKAMVSFRHLDFLSVGSPPPGQQLPFLSIEALGLFAGNLYFESFAIYQNFCSFLGLITDQATGEDIFVSNEGFVDERGRKLLGWATQCPFKTNPLRLVKAVMSIRRRGYRSQQSHMANIIDVNKLAKHDFEA